MENNKLEIRQELAKEIPQKKPEIKSIFALNPDLKRSNLLVLALINAISFGLLITNFYQVKLGLLLFTTVLLATVTYYFKQERMIVNKKTYLYLIPIAVILIGNTIYSNETILNVLSVILLSNVYIVKLIKFNFKEVFDFSLIFNSDKFSRPEVMKSFTKESESNHDVVKKVFKGLMIAVVPLMIVGSLLISSDRVFEQLIINFLDNFEIGESFFRLIRGFIFFFVIQYLILNYIASKDEKVMLNKQFKGDKIIINTVLTSFNLMFLVFCYIQLRYLIFNSGDISISHIGVTISYANYAREGFFQLLFVTAINYSMIILLFSKYKDELKNKSVKAAMILLSVFTIILIFSSFYRMHLYTMNYGLTTLRIQVIIFLVLELIVFLLTLMNLVKSKYSIAKLVFVFVIIGAMLNATVANEYVAASYNFAGGKNRYEISPSNVTYDSYFIYKDYFDDSKLKYRWLNQTNSNKSWEDISLFEYLYYNK